MVQHAQQDAVLFQNLVHVLCSSAPQGPSSQWRRRRRAPGCEFPKERGPRKRGPRSEREGRGGQQLGVPELRHFQHELRTEVWQMPSGQGTVAWGASRTGRATKARQHGGPRARGDVPCGRRRGRLHCACNAHCDRGILAFITGGRIASPEGRVKRHYTSSTLASTGPYTPTHGAHISSSSPPGCSQRASGRSGKRAERPRRRPRCC